MNRNESPSELPDDPGGALPAVDVEAWRAEVARELRGADPERVLTTLTREGLRLEALVTAAPPPAPELRAAALERLRAGRPSARVLPLSCAGGPAGLAARAAEELEGGADGLTVLAADAPSDAAGWAALWTAAGPGRGPWLLPGGADTLALAALAVAGAEQAGVQPGPLLLGADPLGALAAAGEIPLHLDQAADELAELLAPTSGPTLPPGSRVLGVDLCPWVAGGADLAQALGWALSDAFWLVRALGSRGLPLPAVAGQLQVTVPMGRDLLTNIAALRALRVVWARAMRAAGLGDPPPLWVHATTSPAVLSRRDPAVNALRGAVGAFAALVGGADSLSVAPMDQARGLPSARGLRLARNTPLILIAEAHLGEVQDPAGGAFALEALTDALARRSWERVQELEREGGAARSLLDGRVLGRVAEAQQGWTRALRRRVQPTVGVSDWADPAEEPAPHPMAAPEAKPTVGRLVSPVGQPPPLPEQGLYAALVALARAGAERGALDQALGRGPAMRVKALEPLADSAPFEALRDRVDAHLAAGGAAPTVFLANVGPVSEWKARATWTRNLLQAGGLRVLEDEDGAPPEQSAAVAAQRFVASGAQGACVCAADARLAELAVPVASALREAGASPLLLAGKPGGLEPGLREAGVGAFVFLGQDAVEALEGLLDALGVSR